MAMLTPLGGNDRWWNDARQTSCGKPSLVQHDEPCRWFLHSPGAPWSLAHAPKAKHSGGPALRPVCHGRPWNGPSWRGSRMVSVEQCVSQLAGLGYETSHTGIADDGEPGSGLPTSRTLVLGDQAPCHGLRHHAHKQRCELACRRWWNPARTVYTEASDSGVFYIVHGIRTSVGSRTRFERTRERDVPIERNVGIAYVRGVDPAKG